MADEDDAWVEIRRFNDAMPAQLLEQFLRDHEFPVKRLGSGNLQAGLDRFTGVVDIRLLVPASRLEEVRDALTAYDAAVVDDHPFRGPSNAPAGDGDEARDAKTAATTRSARAALVLALLVPLGGGHFYARHERTGLVLLAGILGGFVGSMYFGAPTLMLAAMLVVAIDGVGATWAARRHNAGKTWSAARQTLWGLAAVAVAYAGAWSWERYGETGGRNLAWEPLGTHTCAEASPEECSAQCDRGNAPSCVLLAGNALRGRSTDPDECRRAVAALERACAAGYPYGCANLGQVLVVGMAGISADPARAAPFLERGCTADVGPACTTLGLAYAKGLIPSADKDDAWRAFNRGCQLGDTRACEQIRRR